MGLPLYLKLGFRELDRIEVDLAEFGWDGSEKERYHVHGKSLSGKSVI